MQTEPFRANKSKQLRRKREFTTASALHKICVNERFNVAVHDSLNIAGLLTRAMILDHCVGLENIAANLAAPFDFFHFTLNIRHVFHAFAFLDFKQLAAEHTHCCFAVLNLAAFVLALNNDTRREMRYADRGGCFVNMLSACSARTIGINTDIIGIYLNITRIIVKNRSYIQRGKRGVPAPGGVKRGDSNKPVNTLFRLKVTVGIVPLALKGDGLDQKRKS